jgi:hypothetical protein
VVIKDVNIACPPFGLCLSRRRPSHDSLDGGARVGDATADPLPFLKRNQPIIAPFLKRNQPIIAQLNGKNQSPIVPHCVGNAKGRIR